MKTRRRIAWICLLGIIAGGVVFLSLLPHEPAYQGKQLSVWIDRYAACKADGRERGRDEAVTAIQHIGTNGIPFLLEDLRATDPRWMAAVNWLAGRVNCSVSLGWALKRNNRVAYGFQALGHLATPAIPTLSQWMAGTNLVTARSAEVALRCVGSEEVVPILMSGLTNSDRVLRNWAVVHLGVLGRISEPAVPALLTNLMDADPYARKYAAQALGRIGSRPEVVVSALGHALGDSDRTIRMAAIAALANFGPDAAAAVPALRKVAEGSDEGQRSLARQTLKRLQCEMRDGGIVRGPKDRKRVALTFTGHGYAEGGETILQELARHHGKASFFLTGEFLTNTNFVSLVQRIVRDGHYLGPHSDKHLLYCSWEADRKTLVSYDQFIQDLESNLDKITRFGVDKAKVGYFLPAYEHYNRQIVAWTELSQKILINFTPGTRSNADYTGEADKNFVSSQAIFDSIVAGEQQDPHGLNGFILLLHIGSGPERKDKFHARFGELLDYLAGKGYQFVRVDELLDAKTEDAK